MKTKSFTLIELLVVIVIIGILAGVIIVSTSSSINKANFAKAQAFSNTVQQELLLNLVSEWTFDNSSNIGEDTWGNNNGSVEGSPILKTKEECVFGTCLGFNGTNSISVPDKPEFNFGTQMSAFIWIKGNNTSVWQGILTQRDEGTLNQRSWLMCHGTTAANKLRVILSSNGSATTKDYYTIANILDNVWHLVGFTWNNGTLKLYIDGQEAEVVKSTDNAMTALFNSTSNIGIGCYYYNGNIANRFRGSFDDVSIYNVALSTSQIKQEYIAGLNSLLANNNISKEEYDQRLNNLAYDKE